MEDINGIEMIRILDNQLQRAGENSLEIDVSEFRTGIYLVFGTKLCIISKATNDSKLALK